MTLIQAERKSRRERWIGRFLKIFSAILILGSLLKGCDLLVQNSSLPPMNVIANVIFGLYQGIPGIPTLWVYAPSLNLEQPLDPSNMEFLVVFGLMLIGAQLLQSGKQLSQRIARIYEKVQEEHWRNQAGGNQSNEGIRIQIEMPVGDNWWTRPVGIVGLAIIGIVIAQAIMVELSLSH